MASSQNLEKKLFMQTFQVQVPLIMSAALFVISNEFWHFDNKLEIDTLEDAKSLMVKAMNIENQTKWLFPFEILQTENLTDKKDGPYKLQSSNYFLSELIFKVKRDQFSRGDNSLNYSVKFLIKAKIVGLSDRNKQFCR